MKFLVLSDLHHLLSDEVRVIKETAPACDVCVLLGDVLPIYVDIIGENVSIPVYYLYGGHDETGMFEKLGVHIGGYNTVTVNGVTFAGYDGSSRYKNGDNMVTQKQSMIDSKAANKDVNIDILFSHDVAFGAKIARKLDKAHCGLKGIAKFLKKRKPLFHIHGHLHIPCEYAFGRTKCVCVYRGIVFDYDGGIGRVERVF